jgi:1,4-alpha-glucan branching enzyme
MGNFYGSFVLVLHSHLPYVLHHDRMDEEWLFEAAAETYIPLLNALHNLVRDGISPRITIGLSPVLAEQLRHPHFKHEFQRYCEMKVRYAERDQAQFGGHDAHLEWLAKMWSDFYSGIQREFRENYFEDIVGSFRWLQDQGHIEVITCGATHGYFPMLGEDTAIQAQVKMAVRSYGEMFGRPPRGIWLPECGYRPAGMWSNPVPSLQWQAPRLRKGVDEFLSENNLGFFIVDHNQTMKATPWDLKKSPMETYNLSAAQIPGKPVTIFSRDIELSRQVWEHEVGYPGDSVYLDFHKRHSEGKHRYWKITDAKLDMQYKNRYYPDDAFQQRVKEHAGHYKWLIKESLRSHFELTGRPTLIMTAFDAELFGHWWFEGPTFLYHVLKWIAMDPEINAATCSEYLSRQPAYDFIRLPESSWGRDYSSVTWMNPDVHWAWERIYSAEHEIQELARQHAGLMWDEPFRRVVRQAIRELLMLEASDWEFMISNWSTRDHAERRVIEHHEDFKRLISMAWKWAKGAGNNIPPEDWEFLSTAEWREGGVFAEPELWWYEKLEVPPRNC